MEYCFNQIFGSLIGIYGKTVENTSKILLKHNMIHFLGTDSHNTNIYSKMTEIQKKLSKVINNDSIERLTSINPQKLINDEDIEILKPINYKKTWWF